MRTSELHNGDVLVGTVHGNFAESVAVTPPTGAGETWRAVVPKKGVSE